MNDLGKLEENVIAALRALYHRCGYSRFKMSKFEPYDLYMRNKEFLVSDGVITFTDTDGTLMALKPDVTLSIVKNFREKNTSLQKVCYDENVYRIAGASRTYREIMQTGLECLGDIGLYEIGEVLCLAAKSLAAISSDFVLDITHMGIVFQILAQLQLDRTETSEVLRLLNDKNSDALVDMLGKARAEKLLSLLELSGPFAQVKDALQELTDEETFGRICTVFRILDRAGLGENVTLDLSIIADENYYNDFVFRGYIEGIPTAVLAGGQYDKLMKKMGKRAGGVGFAVYLDQLELLDTRVDEHDIDTLVLYDDTADVVSLSDAVAELSAPCVMTVRAVPSNIRYRKLMRFENGRLITIEENG